MKILSVVGARPNFIKMAPLHKELVRHSHTHIVVHTGQHYDKNLSGDFFNEFGLPEPDYNLGIKSQDNTTQLSKMLDKVGEVICHEDPDCVVIYGDTNSSLAGALASAQNHYPVIHVEAGVRNGDLRIIENLNRIIIDRISQINICSTKRNRDTLMSENIMNGMFTGDLMKDAFNSVKSKYVSKDYIFMTLHRPENVDNKDTLEKILEKIAFTGRRVIWPMHPRASKTFNKIKNRYDRLEIKEPMTYHETISRIKGSKLVITDSGGIQKEAYWAKKPCIVIYDHLAWPEIFDTGNQVLVRHNKIDDMPELIDHFKGTMKHPRLFGEGNAAQKITSIIEGVHFESYFKQGF